MMYQRSVVRKDMDIPSDESDLSSRSDRTDISDACREITTESHISIISIMIFQLRKPDGNPCRASARIFPQMIQSETFRSVICHRVSACSEHQKRKTCSRRQSHHDLMKDRKGRNRMSDRFIQRTRFYISSQPMSGSTER